MDREKFVNVTAQLYLIVLFKTEKFKFRNYHSAYFLFTHWGVFLNPKSIYEYLITNELISFEEEDEVSKGKFHLSEKGKALIETIDINVLIEALIDLEDIKIDKIKSFVLPDTLDSSLL